MQLQSSRESQFRSGYVSIVGRPNVGKSTLLNSILGEKVAIVTSKPQTTRNRIRGIRHSGKAQVIFIDTPGIYRPKEKLGEIMVREAKESLKEVDLILFMVNPAPPSIDDLNIAEHLSQLLSFSSSARLFLVINKVETIDKADLLPLIERYRSLCDFNEIIPVSAISGDGVDTLLKKIIEYLPRGPKYYPEDIYTDQIERFMAAEIIREKIMRLTSDEIPYSVAVDVVRWEEKEKITVIEAVINVEKESQKGIIIGKKGRMLKSIGVASRKEIEKLLNARVYLQLWVKVKEDWKSRDAALRDLGYM